MADNEDLDLGDVFTSPPSPPPPAATFAQYRRPSHLRRGPADWDELSIRLVGAHPLWGHHLWNAARCFAAYLDAHAGALCKGKTVVELGAGGGLPGLVAALCGAREVLLTDYPDAELVENLRMNVAANIPAAARGRVRVEGYIWGRAVDALTSGAAAGCGFDVVLMSDLVFNHSQHDALLQTAEACLARTPAADAAAPCVLVFYTHHRPHLAARDLAFFANARARGWTCEEVVTEQFEPMFPEDAGDEAVRAVVHGWRLTRRAL